MSDRAAEVRARLGATTPGDWTVERSYPYMDGRNAFLVRVSGKPGVILSIVALDADAEFVAHARSDIAWLLERLAAADALCRDSDGYTTGDQDARLGAPPWPESACSEWERHHGHDPRSDCSSYAGCRLLVDPQDILAALEAEVVR